MSIDLSQLPEETQALFENYRQNMAAQEGAQEANVSPQEWYSMLGPIFHLVRDDIVLKLFNSDPRLKPLLPAISPLIRTSRLDDKNQIAAMKLRGRRAARLQLLVLNEKQEMSDLALFDSVVNFIYSVIQDQVNGWRGKLVTERTKILKFEGNAQKKRGGFLDLFRRR